MAKVYGLLNNEKLIIGRFRWTSIESYLSIHIETLRFWVVPSKEGCYIHGFRCTATEAISGEAQLSA